MRARIVTYSVLSGFLILLLSFAHLAGLGPVYASAGSDAGAYADLVVRKVTVTPVRARSGDPIRIEVEWMYWGDLINNYYESTSANVLANGKVVASNPFSYVYGAFLGTEYRHTFVWDTTGVPPGQYRIRGEVPIRIDATPYDNYLDVKEPLVLLPAGVPAPAGAGSGGSAVAENPSWKRR